MAKDEEDQDVTPERDYESEATEMGWKKDYDGPGKIDAKEYVERKPFFDELKKLRRKTKDLEEAIRFSEEKSNRLLEQQRADLLKQLKEEKIKAVEEGDAKKVVELDDNIDQIRQFQPPRQNSTPPPELVVWKEKNEWYEDDEDMQVWADAKAHRIRANRPELTFEQILTELSKEVKKAFPDRFKNPNREKPTSVESGSRSSSGDVNIDDKGTLSPDAKRIFKRMYDAGAWGKMSRTDALSKYTKDLIAMEKK